MNYFLESNFLEVTTSTATVSIRRTDFWINATHILKAGGHNRQAAAIRFKALKEKDIVQGVAAVQGTYVDPLTGLKLCKEYGLSNLENILRKTLEKHGFRIMEILRAQTTIQPIMFLLLKVDALISLNHPLPVDLFYRHSGRPYYNSKSTDLLQMVIQTSFWTLTMENCG